MPVRAWIFQMMFVFWFASRHQALVSKFAKISNPHQEGSETEKQQKCGGIAAELTLDRRRVDRADG